MDYAIAVGDTLAAVVVTPDHSPEDPVKARVDRDVARLLTRFLNQNYPSNLSLSECDLEGGYVVPAPL
jgi:hypothetical protein